MPNCILCGLGETFSVDEFLRESPFQTTGVWHKGVGRSGSRRPAPKHSGFTVTVSEADDDFSSQVEDAMRFLVDNDTELRRLQNTPGIQNMALDFGISSHLEKPGVAAQCNCFPPRLIRLAADLNMALELSFYPAIQKDQEESS